MRMFVSKKVSAALIGFKPIELEARRETPAEPPQTDEQRKRATLMLQAFSVGAVIATGPQSTEEYRDFKVAEKFKGELPVMHEGAGDILYQVPNKAPGLVQVLDPGQQLVGPFEGDGFYRKLQGYVDGTGSEAPKVNWLNSHAAVISGVVKAGQVVNVKISSVPGWKATVGGNRVAIVKDSLDFMTIKPECNGACEIKLEWLAPVPVWLTGFVSGLAVLFCLMSLRKI